MENENIVSTVTAMQNALYVMITAPFVWLRWPNVSDCEPESKALNERVNMRDICNTDINHVLTLYNDICDGKCEITSQHHIDEVIDTLRCVIAFKRLAAEEDKSETEEA